MRQDVAISGVVGERFVTTGGCKREPRRESRFARFPAGGPVRRKMNPNLRTACAAPRPPNKIPFSLRTRVSRSNYVRPRV